MRRHHADIIYGDPLRGALAKSPNTSSPRYCHGRLAPRNVWESTTSDRISERINGSIFEVPIAVADISDLNPNVMLELGLWLASKKPTVVVANTGGDIPFDIRDFHATFYPADLNILDMEDFFRKFGKVLQEKHAAFVTGDAYTPFLGKVIVDVASPETREVGVNELLLTRLDEINSRIGAVEGAVRRSRSSSSGNVAAPRTPVGNAGVAGVLNVEVPNGKARAFRREALTAYEIDETEDVSSNAGVTLLRVHFSGAQNHESAWDLIAGLARKHGGDMEVPF